MKLHLSPLHVIELSQRKIQTFMGFDHSRGNIFYLGGAGGGVTVGDFRHNPNIKQLKLL